jgi:hypothetical protein
MSCSMSSMLVAGAIVAAASFAQEPERICVPDFITKRTTIVYTAGAYGHCPTALPGEDDTPIPEALPACF